MDTRAVIELVRQTPQVQQAIDIIEEQLARAPIMPEDLDEMIRMLEAVVRDPKRYPEVRAAAVQDGLISDEEAPREYSPEFVLAVLVALYGYRDRLSKQGYARGGLRVSARRLQDAGRGGDSMLAHINPREAEMLRRMGGAGTVNPNTGLREYKSAKKILGAVLPIALNFIVPGIGGTIGSALTGAAATSATAAAVGSAVIGGLSAGLTGGNVLQGAVLGGLGGGLGSTVGGAASDALSLGLGETGKSILGSALVGGAMGAATGQGFGKGALMGAAGAGLGALGQGVGEGAVGAGIGSGTRMAGNMLAAGFSPKQALIGGGLAGLAAGTTYKAPEPTTGSGLQMKPSDAVVDGLKAQSTPSDVDFGGYRQNYLTGKMEFVPGSGPVDYSLTAGGAQQPGGTVMGGFRAPPNVIAPNVGAATPATGGGVGDLFSLKNLGTAALLSQMAASRPPDVAQAIKELPTKQQEYFNRPSVEWDWQKMQNDANAQNMSLSRFMASFWPQITSGAYNKTTPAQQPGGMARGGALSRVAYLARGAGTGRDDTINARLSDGEYVMDAETVAMLGDGSTDAGARKLDQMRAQLRKHKGKALSRGKFSPDAKSPLSYVKGVA